MLPELDRSIGSFDAEQCPYVIEQGERAAEAQLPYLRRLLAAADARHSPGVLSSG
ncbi:MAG TPA: hypothetical protein VFL17_14105 [Anaerolineae bacterium]|nr:hypothetical protein [Anaerolineae bacterium]